MDPLMMAGLAMGVIQMGDGVLKKKKAASIASRNVHPDRTTPQGITDNLALAENMASQGLSDASMAAYTNNADRGLSTSLEAILRSGGGNNMIKDVFDGYGQDLSKMALADDDARMKKLGIYMAANKDNANEDDLNWQINKYAPWADTAQLASQLSTDGMKEISGGIQTGFGAFAASQQAKMKPDAGLPNVTNERWARGGDKLSDVLDPRQGWATGDITDMLAPNPMRQTYSQKSLATLNSLGLKPMPGTNSIGRF